MKRLFILVMSFAFAAQLSAKEIKESDNPLLVEWKTPFNTPPFSLIKTEHFKPAFIEGMKQQIAEVDAIINNDAEPTFENTIDAFEQSGKTLEKVAGVFFHLTNANTSPELQSIYREMSPLLSKHSDDISLNPKLFERIKYLHNNQSKLKLTKEQTTLLDKYYKNFVRSGANLNDADKEKLMKINEELSMASLKFREHVLNETNNFELIIDNEKNLSGLPQSSIDAAKLAAKEKGYEDKWLFSLQAPSYRPFVIYSDNRELREKMFKASTMRANNNNENDNKSIVEKMVLLRLQRANLLGYKTHADFILDEYMAKNPKTVYDFLLQIWKPALTKAKKELAELQTLAAKEGFNSKIQPWDWSYYSEKLKKEKYDFDEEMLRPYFKLENVIDGLFTVVNKLYGLKIEERNDIDVYHHDVRVFEIKEADGKHVGIIYTDYYPRESKRAGAWSNNFRYQSNLNGEYIYPICFNTCNLTKPTEDSPSLLTLDEVETLFHEFGHALHGLLSNVTYPSFSGTNVAWDFVELPSQIMEHWVSEPEVLKMYAKHYKTGETMPDELIEKIKAVSKYNQGFATVSYLSAALLDMDYHTVAKEMPIKTDEFEKNLFDKLGLMPEIGVRYTSTIFSHIFAGGYSSGYYSYIWAEVLDTDAFEAFKEKGVFDQTVANSFRKNILAKGGSEEPMVLYKKFRGSEPKVEGILKKRGLIEE
ncbi:MAG TPA: M3 family metallopeptidase [Ignavibacteriaceae bacterium]|nr:M3 family metallopeptidase [Ignavibacteriaceae bacterium]